MFLKKLSVFFYLIFISLSFKVSSNESIKAELLKKIEGPIPEWMTKQLDIDFENVKPITIEMIDQIFKNYKGFDGYRGGVAKYSIKAGKITVDINQKTEYHFNIVNFINKFFEELNEYIQLPDTEFLVVLDDVIYPEQSNVPLFTFSKKTGEKNSILIPDYQVLDLVKNGGLNDQLKFAEAYLPWNLKQFKAIWRGSNTGKNYTLEDFKEKPRVKLVALSKKMPNIIDASFHHLHDYNKEVMEELIKLDYKGNYLTIADHLTCKYQILIDGNSASWPGAYWRFSSNSLVLKQNSNFIQWYYSLLKPYVHYVPFQDIEDLTESIIWAINNDEKAQEIVKNANELVSSHLKYVDMLYYIYVAITRYTKLLKID